MGPTTFCLTGPHGTHLGTPTWAFPCWSQLGPIFIFTWDTPGHSHSGNPMWVPIGTHIYFHMGHTCAFSLGHSHVGPNWDPSFFSLGTHLGIPTWAFPCWSQLGPIFIFIWEPSGHSHLGIPMLVPIETHIYFHMGHTWAFPLWHSHVRPNWDPLLGVSQVCHGCIKGVSLGVMGMSWVCQEGVKGMSWGYIPVIVIPNGSLQIGMKRFMLYIWYDML